MYRFFLIFLVVARLEGTPDEQIHAGFSCLNEGKWGEAEGIFSALQSDGNAAVQNFALLGMAKLAIHEKRFADAKAFLNKMDQKNLIPIELKQEWILTNSDLALKLGQYEIYFEWLKKADRESLDSMTKSEILIHEGSVEIGETTNTLLQSQVLAKLGKFDEAIELLKQSPPQEKQAFLIGTYFHETKKFNESRAAFEEFLSQYPESSLVPEALYWTEKYKELYKKYPDHPLAADAYFNCYTPQEYLLGEKEALKHLNAFSSKFPKSPLILHASYYIGLDCLHDRRTFEGKWISRQNLIGAIEAFQNVETYFHELQEPPHLKEICDQAILERAKANLKIAEASKAAKKAIYLDYAEEVFSKLLSNIYNEEALYFLALTQIQSGKTEQAIKSLDSLIANSKDYYLAAALYQKGLLKNSIPLFDQSLEAGQKHLSNDEILKLMIAKAEVYRKDGKLDEAMLQLSEVVNYSTASSLRLKAMFLRAEIYTQQGRKQLAQKQLESIALKGGDWAQKAKEQLDKYE